MRRLDSDIGSLDSVVDEVFVPWIEHYRTWEVGEAELLRGWLKPGMTFVDVGAHVGYFTLLARERIGARGRVVALEPDADNYSVLARNVRARGYRNVATVNAAAWSEPRSLSLRRSSTNSGDHRVRADADGMQRVPGLVLDDLLPSSMRVDVVKIDTQGADHHVMRGLRATLARWRPRLVVEFWPPGIDDVDPASLPDFYRSLGYTVGALEAKLASTATGDAFVRAAAAADHEFLTLVLEAVDA